MNLRAILFAPGDSERKMNKALSSEAEAVVLDLEDAVGPSSKVAARTAVAALLPGISREGVVVRVNAQATPWYLADLAAIVPGRPAMVMLPKCSGSADLLALDHHLEALETAFGLPVGNIGILPLVTETAASTMTMDYRGASKRLRALCFGSEDLSSELGVLPRDDAGGLAAPVRQVRAATLLAAAAAGVPAIDTPYTDPRDSAGLDREVRLAVRDGFAGKFCIHPSQVASVQAAFTPTAERVRWAEAVCEAFRARPDAGVLSLDGKMIERMHLRLAERTLASVA